MIKTFHRGFWLLAGLFFFVLGIIGLLLPVVPQLPFFLASILCFMRCSKRFSGWMEKKPWFIQLRTRFHNLRHLRDFKPKPTRLRGPPDSSNR